MKYFLLGVASVYKLAIIAIIFGSIYYVLTSDASAGKSLASVIDFILIPILWFWNNIQLPIVEWCINLFEGSGISETPGDTIMWFLKLAGAVFGTLLALIYFPIVLLVMPIWTIFEPIMVYAWGKLLNPLGVFNVFVLPLSVELGNNIDMVSENPVVRQGAINNDLADKINGKVATKQTIIGR